MKYPDYATELMELLKADQIEKRKVGNAYFHAGKQELESLKTSLRQHTQERTKRMLAILDTIGEPSISNVGINGAQAISVLAVHDPAALEKVLDAFVTLYEKKRSDTYYQAIPSMTDLSLIMAGKPQRFGTQWLFDENKQPFLPTVEDFEHVNERRAEYGIEPLRWPKSLAIPESEQPWLKQPLSKLVMRNPTDRERKELEG